ncbi:hypothetical protein Hanom_Chr10g00961941 [Helianthus anomalus]
MVDVNFFPQSFCSILNAYIVIGSIQVFFNKCDVKQTFPHKIQQVINFLPFDSNSRKGNRDGC